MTSEVFPKRKRLHPEVYVVLVIDFSEDGVNFLTVSLKSD